MNTEKLHCFNCNENLKNGRPCKCIYECQLIEGENHFSLWLSLDRSKKSEFNLKIDKNKSTYTLDIFLGSFKIKNIIDVNLPLEIINDDSLLELKNFVHSLLLFV